MQKLRERRALQQCPLCHERLEEEALRLRDCSGCSTTYHHLCVNELGGCSTLGCPRHQTWLGSARFEIPPGRLAEIRRQVAEENRRQGQLTSRQPSKSPHFVRSSFTAAMILATLIYWTALAFAKVPLELITFCIGLDLLLLNAVLVSATIPADDQAKVKVPTP